MQWMWKKACRTFSNESCMTRVINQGILLALRTNFITDIDCYSWNIMPRQHPIHHNPPFISFSCHWNHWNENNFNMVANGCLQNQQKRLKVYFNSLQCFTWLPTDDMIRFTHRLGADDSCLEYFGPKLFSHPSDVLMCCHYNVKKP